MTTKIATSRTIAEYVADEHCDICDLFKPLPVEKAAWDAGGVSAQSFYEHGICISRGSNNDPSQPEKYCRERAVDWRALALLADKAIRAMRTRESASAQVENAVVTERPDIAGTMEKINKMQSLGAALECEETAVSAYEKARGRR